jgi:hypothetical protein
MLQMDVALVLLDPGLDGMAGLTNVDLTTLAGHAAHARSLGSQVTLHRLKEKDLLQWSPTDLMCLDSSLLIRFKVVLHRAGR